MRKTLLFLIFVISGNTYFSAEAGSQHRDRLEAGNANRNLSFSSWFSQAEKPCNNLYFPMDPSTTRQALLEYGTLVQGGSPLEDRAKRFKHGRSATILIQFGNGNKVVVKICERHELEENKSIPKEFRNCDIYFREDRPCLQLLSITHAWVGGRLQTLDDIDLSEIGGFVITFQPFFEGTSNFFSNATTDQITVWAETMGQAICFASEHHIVLNDFHNDNYRYDPIRGMVGIFDFASGNGTTPFEEITYSLLAKALVPNAEVLSYDYLKHADFSALARAI
ncbi:MAG: hypothetical protein LBJ89_00630 [Holosporales bacterium]|jgi:hypothetical protein|nr:hypothetical protein [Holosporales bacterium]